MMNRHEMRLLVGMFKALDDAVDTSADLIDADFPLANSEGR
jgi:hypothetical protein